MDRSTFRQVKFSASGSSTPFYARCNFSIGLGSTGFSMVHVLTWIWSERDMHNLNAMILKWNWHVQFRHHLSVRLDLTIVGGVMEAPWGNWTLSERFTFFSGICHMGNSHPTSVAQSLRKQFIVHLHQIKFGISIFMSIWISRKDLFNTVGKVSGPVHTHFGALKITPEHVELLTALFAAGKD